MDSQDHWREMMQNHRDLPYPLNGDFLRFNGIYGIFLWDLFNVINDLIGFYGILMGFI